VRFVQVTSFTEEATSGGKHMSSWLVRTFKLAVGALLLTLFSLAGCKDKNADTSADCEEVAASSTFEAIQLGIFERHNCVGCHNDSITEGGLDLRSEVAHANLVRVAAESPIKMAKQRVFPGEQAESLLYLKLAAAVHQTGLPMGAGSMMPPEGREPISADELEAIRLWIRGGASKTGVVAGTQKLLSCNALPDKADPNKLPPLEPPTATEGIQFEAGRWLVPAMSEDEVCFATYWDFTVNNDVPDWAKVSCAQQNLAGQECFAVNDNLLAQDPQSHHSIVSAYIGSAGPLDPAWGEWTCHGGADEGKACDPTKIGVLVAEGGADCGPRSACASAVTSRTACIGWGPRDFRSNRIGLSGAQKPISRIHYPEGVYSTLPMKGVVVWNSHAFNLTEQDTTLEQWINLEFARSEEQLYLNRGGIVQPRDIFAMNIPPFETQEICSTWTAPLGAHITRFGSHVHQRGVLFRVWAPPQDTSCNPDNGCLPDETEPFYLSRIYNDSVELFFDEPVVHNETDAKDRTYKFCAVFDNGSKDMWKVKRNSLSVGSTCPARERECIGGPMHNSFCNGDDSYCDSSPGAGDGVCDACPVVGGVTTEDEMFLLLGNYYLVN